MPKLLSGLACPAPRERVCWAQTSWYGDTADARRIHAARATPEARTAVMAGYLIGAPSMHTGGSFRTSRSTNPVRAAAALAKLVSGLLVRSPALCYPNTTLHIVHDVNATVGSIRRALADDARTQVPPQLRHTANETVRPRARVVFHRFEPAAGQLGNDRRWALIERVLRSIHWDCAWSIDISDVGVVRLPSCGALPDDKLLIASDGNTKKWLRRVAGETRWNETMTERFARFLAPQDSTPVASCGIVGGARKAFEPALRRAVHLLQQHVARHAVETVLRPGSDMIIWNTIALERPHISGYPHGPVSYPFMGTPYIDRHRVCPDGTCRHRFLNETRGQYWFAHKVPSTWYPDILSWYRPGATCEEAEVEANLTLPLARNIARRDFVSAG